MDRFLKINDVGINGFKEVSMGIGNIAVIYCDLMISILDMVGGFNQKILSLHCTGLWDKP